jgi:hypothetical protein
MVKRLEGPFLLNIREMTIPFELDDLRNPLRAKWKKREYTERELHCRMRAFEVCISGYSVRRR